MSNQYGFTVSEIKTVVAITATFTLLIVMCRACIPFNRFKAIFCIAMCALSITLIVLSTNNIMIFGKISAYDLFGFDNLTWEVSRPELGPGPFIDATALWLAVTMVIFSLS